MIKPNRMVVLGLGNVLLGDEGFGIHALHFTQTALNSQPGVEWVDGGVLGLDLLPLVEGCSHLLVLDALDAGLPGGTLIELAGEEIPLYAGIKLSEHQLGFQEVLGLAKLRRNYPEHLHLIAVQPVQLSPGVMLSLEVQKALPDVLQSAREVLEGWSRNS